MLSLHNLAFCKEVRTDYRFPMSWPAVVNSFPSYSLSYDGRWIKTGIWHLRSLSEINNEQMHRMSRSLNLRWMSLSLHSTAVQYVRKLIGFNTSQSAENFKLARLLVEPFCFFKPSFNRIRLHASPLRFKSVRLEGSIVYLDEYQFDGLKRQLKPFAVCLGGDRSLFEAVLVYMGFTEAMMYLFIAAASMRRMYFTVPLPEAIRFNKPFQPFNSGERSQRAYYGKSEKGPYWYREAGAYRKETNYWHQRRRLSQL